MKKSLLVALMAMALFSCKKKEEVKTEEEVKGGSAVRAPIALFVSIPDAFFKNRGQDNSIKENRKPIFLSLKDGKKIIFETNYTDKGFVALTKTLDYDDIIKKHILDKGDVDLYLKTNETTDILSLNITYDISYVVSNVKFNGKPLERITDRGTWHYAFKIPEGKE